MFLAETIVRNFIEGISEEDFLQMEALNDEAAYQYLSDLYEKSYSVKPTGVTIYLLKTMFKFGTEVQNRRYIPAALLV